MDAKTQFVLTDKDISNLIFQNTKPMKTFRIKNHKEGPKRKRKYINLMKI